LIDRAHIRDFHEAVGLLTPIYQPRQEASSRFVALRRADSLDACVSVTGPRASPIVKLRFGGAVVIDAALHDMTIIKKCLRGSGSVHQYGRLARWSVGSVIPIARDGLTRFDLDRQFDTVSLAVDSRKLEALCSNWLGHPLETQLRLALVPFSDTLQRAWNSTLTFVESISTGGADKLPAAAEAALDEFVMTLLLRGHPHNYSDELARPEKDPRSRVVKRAIRFIEDHPSAELTAAKLAAGAGVSIRALQSAFRNWRNITPTEYLRTVRLQRVRDELLQADALTTVTAVALDHGFLHLGRFSQHYKSAFRESPAATLSQTKRPRAPAALRRSAIPA
jgi:AraC-like DNA-binding protein